MSVPVIFGFPLHLWLGLLLLLLLTFQVLTGKRIIKLPFTWHRGNAVLITVTAVIHAFIALGVNLWGFALK